MLQKKIISAVLTGIALAIGTSNSWAATVDMTATGSGWCREFYGCNNTNTNTIDNTFAGNNPLYPGASFPEPARDWFAFTLPTLGTISSASIFIWNDADNFNTVNSSALFNLYQASGISYAGLTNGSSLGSILVDQADSSATDGFVEIQLNAFGLAALSASQGSQFVFGGNNDDGEQIFGYTFGTPAAILRIDTVSVPEPSSLALMGLGLLAVCWQRRKTLLRNN